MKQLLTQSIHYRVTTKVLTQEMERFCPVLVAISSAVFPGNTFSSKPVQFHGAFKEYASSNRKENGMPSGDFLSPFLLTSQSFEQKWRKELIGPKWSYLH